MTWMSLWTGVLVLCMGLFVIVAVGVAIGGARDLRKMFRTLSKNPTDDHS